MMLLTANARGVQLSKFCRQGNSRSWTPDVLYFGRLTISELLDETGPKARSGRGRDPSGKGKKGAMLDDGRRAVHQEYVEMWAKREGQLRQESGRCFFSILERQAGAGAIAGEG